MEKRIHSKLCFVFKRTRRARKPTPSLKLGKEEYPIEVLPMNFEEFMWIMNDDITTGIIKEHYTKLKPLGKMNKDIMKSFR